MTKVQYHNFIILWVWEFINSDLLKLKQIYFSFCHGCCLKRNEKLTLILIIKRKFWQNFFIILYNPLVQLISGFVVKLMIIMKIAALWYLFMLIYVKDIFWYNCVTYLRSYLSHSSNIDISFDIMYVNWIILESVHLGIQIISTTIDVFMKSTSLTLTIALQIESLFLVALTLFCISN